ncbi:MAG: twin-arginine translocation signal domain-containing protein [Halobacteriales archaeon]|nr:twin-arginine translocation signal domain-containing protein [Halobacteriales archaeon]
MELTRRDALVALGVAGTAGVTGAYAVSRLDGEDTAERVVERLPSVAEVVYPSEVEVGRDFLETYVVGRVEERDGYLDGVADALDSLDGYTRRLRDEEFADAPVERRDDLLRYMGVDEAEPEPDGAEVERVRYYVVNELQYALYASPVGGRLVGIENPVGYPGGLDSYRREP